MRKNMEYKGYHAHVAYDYESRVLYGKIEGIKDLVDFYVEDTKKAEEAFHEAVDDYLEFCREVGKTPEKEYRGSFNVRIAPELHRELAVCAGSEGKSLNSLVELAIKSFLERRKAAARKGASKGEEVSHTTSFHLGTLRDFVGDGAEAVTSEDYRSSVQGGIINNPKEGEE